MAEYYPLLRQLHITFAALSIIGFVLRSGLLLAGSTLYRNSRIRRLTDTNDALLLLAALGLMTATGQYPWVTPWLTAKVGAVLAYIILGVVAFRWARTAWQKTLAVLAAWSVLGYVVSVAVSKNPCGFLAALC